MPGEVSWLRSADMLLQRLVGVGQQIAAWFVRRGPRDRVGDTEVADARRLADAERALGLAPMGCTWLDDRTVDDLDLGLVFRSIDRTVTPTGAQALWRWLAAPAHALEPLAERERSLARLAAEPQLRGQIRSELAGALVADAPLLPRLLWEPAPQASISTRWLAVLVIGFATVTLLAAWWPKLLLVSAVLLGANLLIDNWANLRLAHLPRALEVLGELLGTATRLIERRAGPPDLLDALARDVTALGGLRRQIRVLSVTDPFELLNLVRSGLLVRLFVFARCAATIERERARLRRVVLAMGELDALVSVASLRAERGDTSVPELTHRAPHLAGHGIVHPSIAHAIGNDVVLDRDGLLITGSNMSGKSTLLRAVAVNAICAQSIHTTFGRWRASLVRVFAVMRIEDDTAHGLSTYAVEVRAIGALVAEVTRQGGPLPALFVIDEPFRGTNPAARVPIVVSVLSYLVEHDLVVAATHDLEVAAQLDARFVRGYFCELGASEAFDWRLRPGIAPSTNALEMLARAGYPAAIVDAASRCAGGPHGAARPGAPGSASSP